MDPYAVLGLAADASVEDAARAYKQLAKEWHPDRAGEAGAARMIQLNVAYELVRSAQRPSVPGPRASVPTAADTTRRGAGHWLPEAMRRALGRELLDALETDEPVE